MNLETKSHDGVSHHLKETTPKYHADGGSLITVKRVKGQQFSLTAIEQNIIR